MAKWLYSSRGDPIAFVHGEYVFSESGTFVGRLDGDEVWHGEYVGEIVRDDRFLRHRNLQRQAAHELLNREIFYTLKEAQVLIEAWREEYNPRQPHSSLGYRPLVPEAVQVAVGLT